MPDSSAINSMFGRIARRYDFANLLLSGGCCVAWTRRLAREAAQALAVKDAETATTTAASAVAAVPAHPRPAADSPATQTSAVVPLPENGNSAVAIDLATGSGDVAFALARRAPEARVRGFDFCEPMLERARARLAATERASTASAHPPAPLSASPPPPPPENVSRPVSDLARRVSFERGDCMALPLADAAADVVTVAYGVRNFQDRARGLREIHRVLRTGGSAFVLEFSQPARWFRPFYYFYLRRVLPWLARAATGDRAAYEYLCGSIAAFPCREAFSRELLDAGFTSVRAIPLTFGIVAIHHARK